MMHLLGRTLRTHMQRLSCLVAAQRGCKVVGAVELRAGSKSGALVSLVTPSANFIPPALGSYFPSPFFLLDQELEVYVSIVLV